MLIVGFSFGQDSLDYTWKKIQSYPIADDEVWVVDVLENIYISDNGLINKFDSSGVLWFSQSIKSLGNTTQLIPVNSMKLIHFSEEQQTLCYFDNTLTSMNECVDLTDQDVISAELVCGSSQPNKVWVLDNLNSTLNLLSLDKLRQTQEVKNLRGVLDLDEVTQIKERFNRLFLLDKSKGVYVFDLYATLIQFIPGESIQQLEAFENTLFTVHGNLLNVRSLLTSDNFDVELPVDNVSEIGYQNQFFYFRSNGNVHKYELQFSK